VHLVVGRAFSLSPTSSGRDPGSPPQRGAQGQEGERLALVLLGPGEVSAGGYTLKASAPASLTVEGQKVSVVTQEAGQVVEVTWPDGPTLQVKGRSAAR